MTQANGTNTATAALSADEERVMLALARAESSLGLRELGARLEIPGENLRNAMQSLYQRHFLLVSRGIGQLEDTYLLSQPARAYARRSLMPDAPRELSIETLTTTDKR